MSGNKTNLVCVLGIMLTTTLTACGGGGGGSSADTTPPRVSATNPADAAVDVDTAITPSVTFNEDVLSMTIDSTAFSLMQGSTGVAATVSFDGANNIATLTPDAPLSLLATYTASLTEEITDLSTNPLAPSSWSFTTRDGVWQTPAVIETNNDGTAFSPQIAINASGTAFAAWDQYDGTRNNLWANRYTPTNGWGDAEMIETVNDGPTLNPQIAVTASGNAVAVWQQYDGTKHDVWANQYTPADGWATAAIIDSENLGSAFFPQVAIDTNGNALAVWAQTDGTTNNIWANRYTPTGGWGTAAMIETSFSNSGLSPQIAIDINGNALAVWSQSDGSQNSIWANRYTPAGGWGAAALIESDNAGDASNPQIAIDSSGNALAVWLQSDGVRNNIWANSYTTASGWGTAALIETDDASDALRPQIAIADNGNALAVWRQFDGAQNNIWANRYTPADGWDTAELIETNTAATTFNPQIAIASDNTGKALALWDQTDATLGNVWAIRYTPEDGWGTAELVETNDNDHAFAQQVAIDNTGKALALWVQSDGMGRSVWSNRFE